MIKTRKNRIAMERVIFQNYDYEPYEESAREWFKEEYGDDYEPSESELESEIYEEINNDWEEAKSDLDSFIDSRKWLLMGEVGLWHGVYKAGYIFDDFMTMFCKATKDCDYWKFWDENGHLFLKCSHHDGTNLFEIKEITDKGNQYLRNWEDSWYDKRSEGYVHNIIFERYSRIPRYAEKQWGAPRFDWEPINKANLINKLNNKAESFYS